MSLSSTSIQQPHGVVQISSICWAWGCGAYLPENLPVPQCSSRKSLFACRISVDPALADSTVLASCSECWNCLPRFHHFFQYCRPFREIGCPLHFLWCHLEINVKSESCNALLNWYGCSAWPSSSCSCCYHHRVNVANSFKSFTCSWLIWGPRSRARLSLPNGFLRMSIPAVATRLSITHWRPISLIHFPLLMSVMICWAIVRMIASSFDWVRGIWFGSIFPALITPVRPPGSRAQGSR